jgi:hypothetical protein
MHPFVPPGFEWNHTPKKGAVNTGCALGVEQRAGWVPEAGWAVSFDMVMVAACRGGRRIIPVTPSGGKRACRVL